MERALVIVVAMAGLPMSALAQTPPASPAVVEQASPQALEATLDELRRRVEQQQQLLEAQKALVEDLLTQVAALQQRLDDAAAAAAAVVDAPAQRVPELPAAVVEGEFPGSMRIPGTEAAFRVGGQARMSMVHTFGPLGTDDRFVTSSIPVEGEQVAGEDARTVYSMRPSRLNFELRMPSRIGQLRTFYEADFFGDGNTLRMRHVFISTRRWMFGQTWSTFSDPEAEPVGIDFEGLNAISLFRQPQIRYTHPLGERFNLAASLENPAPDLTGAQGVNHTPDFVARLRWDLRPGPLGSAHVQTAMLVRQLRGELLDQPEVTLSTGGFGVNVSGVIIPRWSENDRIKFASNAGWGIGRYITDLGTLGGQDAVYDPVANDLRALPVSSGYIGYERQWRPSFASAFTYGIVNVDNLDIQPDTALKRTERASLNVTWTPIPAVDLIVELLTGTRVNKDDRRGSSSQLQLGWTFRF